MKDFQPYYRKRADIAKIRGQIWHFWLFFTNNSILNDYYWKTIRNRRMVHTSLKSYFYLDNNIINELQVLMKSTGSIFIFPCSEMTVQGGTLTALEKVDKTKWKNCSKWIKLIHFVHFELLLRKISKYLENVIVFGANGEKSQFCSYIKFT